ncbi:MAG: divalent-cation tolerance protein CutA, partial [Verrucomicrobiales bacterium]|nr:divalent-cation tolerance protein CutA [Verrucomicrobiales bacterium]
TLFKTKEELLDKLELAILELHSYDVPEIIVLPVEGGSKSYLEWIADSTKF